MGEPFLNVAWIMKDRENDDFVFFSEKKIMLGMEVEINSLRMFTVNHVGLGTAKPLETNSKFSRGMHFRNKIPLLHHQFLGRKSVPLES